MKSLPLLAAVLGSIANVGVVSAQTFTNPSAITINDNAAASLYPSVINVSGGPLALTTYPSVRLYGVTHPRPSDLDVLLVGPQGQRALLMSDCGGGGPVVNATITFTQYGPAMPVGPFEAGASGTWRPTDYDTNSDVFPVPAPSGPYITDLILFNGAVANNPWRLYVRDDDAGGGAGESGTISGGWSISFEEPLAGPPAPTSNVFTYQGKLTSGGTPVTGSVDLRFSFWKTPGDGFADAGFGPVITQNNVAVGEGLFTAPIDLGDMFLDNTELWMEIAVRNPAGSGSFQTLSGRQRLTPAIAAQWASKADSANTAVSAQTAAFATNADTATTATTATTAITANSATAANTANFAAAADAAQRLTRPDGVTNAVTVDSAGNVLVGGASQTGAGTLVVSGTQGSFAGSYGGMYVTTPHAHALPFYGYYTAAMSCWTYLDPANSMWRHSWGTSLSSTGNMGIGTDPVAGFRLAVNGNLRCTALTQTSSERYKKDVESITGVLDRFNELRPVTYVWNDTAPESVRGQKTTGLIAEEVYQLFPEAISLDAQGRPDGIDYSRVTAISIQAFKELKAMQAEKDAEIARQKSEINALKARLDAIERALTK